MIRCLLSVMCHHSVRPAQIILLSACPARLPPRRVAALEERQKQLVELCERQVADARESRDEEVARCQQEVALAQGQAARAESEIVAGGWRLAAWMWVAGWMAG